MKVAAAGVNRPDVMQRQGLYPPPPGAPDIPGLELAGTVVERGADANRFTLGEAVCALVAGGGYAEYAVVHETTALRVPQPLPYHLAPRRVFRRFIFGIDHAAGNFQREPADPVPELFDHHYRTVVGERNDVHPRGSVDDKEVAPAAMRVAAMAAMKIENRSAVDDLGLDQVPAAGFHYPDK